MGSESANEELLARATAPEGHSSTMPRAVLVFAHPDDESIALGARLRRFGGAHLLHVTDGAPRKEEIWRRHGFASFPEYHDARWNEFKHAMSVAGIPDISHECLEVPGQEAGLRLSQLTRWLVRVLQMHAAEVVFTHPYEGGHPDHDSCAFAVHHAVAYLKRRKEPAPLIIEGAFYHAGPYQTEIAMGSFLPPPNIVPEASYPLSAEERERKQKVLGCFATQQETLRCFPLDWERFRIAPEYEFRVPAHPGTVLYDARSWGMSSQSFSELAWEADRALEEELKAACC